MKKLKVREYLSSNNLGKGDLIQLVATSLQRMYLDLFSAKEIRWDHILYSENLKLSYSSRLQKVSALLFVLYAYYSFASPDNSEEEIKDTAEMFNIDIPTNEEIETVRAVRNEILNNVENPDSDLETAFQSLGYGQCYRSILVDLLKKELNNA